MAQRRSGSEPGIETGSDVDPHPARCITRAAEVTEILQWKILHLRGELPSQTRARDAYRGVKTSCELISLAPRVREPAAM
jgi:hypothetical protein